MDFSEVSYRRRTAIEDELLALMREVPFEQITVLDIAQRQNIARKTFYRYFPNKQSCLEGLMDRTIYECSIRVLRHSGEGGDMYRHFESWLAYWMEKREFLDAVIRNRLELLLVQRMISYTIREDSFVIQRKNTDRLSCDEDILHFYLSGQVAMLLKWGGEGFTRPMEEMVGKLIRVIYQPLFSREKGT